MIISNKNEMVIFIGLTAYGYTFYALVTRSSHNRGTPLAFCISDDTCDVVKIFLESLKTTARNNGFTFCPRYNICKKMHYFTNIL